MTELRLGSTGTDVRTLQELLNARGYRHPRTGVPLGVDGEFGTETLAAVRQFQASHNLNVNGVVRTLTWWALQGQKSPQAKPTTSGGISLSQPLARRALDVALWYHGYRVREKPPGSNRGGPMNLNDPEASVNAIQRPFFPNAGQPWCAMFVWQCYTQAGLHLELDGFAAVYNWVRWAREHGYLHPAKGFTPQPGDLFCIGECRSYPTALHIGMVEKLNEGNTITTIEGNSDDRVASRIRAVSGGTGGEGGGGGIRYYIRIA